MSALDSDSLISQALQQIGNQTITDLAEIWLLNILDRLYEDFHWPFLEKLTTGSLAQGATSVDLPTDFDALWDENSIVLINSSGGQYPLKAIIGYTQDFLSNPNLLGPPETALIDLNSMTWRPYPLPNQGFTWQLRYKMKPARTDPYANFTPAFPNDEILVQSLFVRALQHEDDDRYGQESGVLAGMIGRYKAKFNKQPHRAKKVRFASRFKTPVSFR